MRKGCGPVLPLIFKPRSVSMTTNRLLHFLRIFLRVSPIFCFMGILFSPLPTHQISWASSPHIHIQSDPPFFSPNQLTISLDTPLTWENRTSAVHSIVADDCRSRLECSFDSGIIRPNHQFVLPRLAPGNYPYHCGLHPFMHGLLTIHPPKSLSSDI